MNPIIIELNEITSDLTPGQLMLLKIIHTSNKKAFQAFSKAYAPHISAMLENLQEKLYIKLTGEEFEDYVCRDKAEVLFSEKDVDFSEFWDNYHVITHLPKTDTKSAKTKWNKLTKAKKRLAIDNVRAYYESLNDKKYCKKARTYLEDENFMDEFTSTGVETDWTIYRA